MKSAGRVSPVEDLRVAAGTRTNARTTSSRGPGPAVQNEVGQQQAAFATTQRFMRASHILPPTVHVQDVLILMEQFANVILPRTQFATKQYETDLNTCGRDRRNEIAKHRAAARHALLTLKEE